MAEKNFLEISDLWQPKYKITKKDRISTYGSCFAQHIGRALRDRDYDWYIAEKGPAGVSGGFLKKYNYGVFSSRTGNIYTTSLLNQWVDWSIRAESQPQEFWECNGRYVDPFRPNIEPNGFQNIEEMMLSRAAALDCFKNSFEDADLFVFTLGLTESWVNGCHGYEYPMCPGTIAGDFDRDVHVFHNQKYDHIKKNLSEAMNTMRKINGNLKFLLTVSPVPLTATVEDRHVVVSTMYSKSVLRAVAGDLSDSYDYVDYFPSYEIINSPVFHGVFYEPNKRSVSKSGVDFVMDEFFKGVQKEGFSFSDNKNVNGRQGGSMDNSAVCEEELLDAFGRKP